jgi:hypothetical protein
VQVDESGAFKAAISAEDFRKIGPLLPPELANEQAELIRAEFSRKKSA